MRYTDGKIIKILKTACRNREEKALFNQIEICFGIINRHLLKRKSYKSIEELKASILRFIEQYNLMVKPFKWTYKSVPLVV